LGAAGMLSVAAFLRSRSRQRLAVFSHEDVLRRETWLLRLLDRRERAYTRPARHPTGLWSWLVYTFEPRAQLPILAGVATSQAFAAVMIYFTATRFMLVAMLFTSTIAARPSVLLGTILYPASRSTRAGLLTVHGMADSIRNCAVLGLLTCILLIIHPFGGLLETVSYQEFSSTIGLWQTVLIAILVAPVGLMITTVYPPMRMRGTNVDLNPYSLVWSGVIFALYILLERLYVNHVAGHFGMVQIIAGYLLAYAAAGLICYATLRYFLRRVDLV
jgi:hypothetical protein